MENCLALIAVSKSDQKMLIRIKEENLEFKYRLNNHYQPQSYLDMYLLSSKFYFAFITLFTDIASTNKNKPKPR